MRTHQSGQKTVPSRIGRVSAGFHGSRKIMARLVIADIGMLVRNKVACQCVLNRETDQQICGQTYNGHWVFAVPYSLRAAEQSNRIREPKKRLLGDGPLFHGSLVVLHVAPSRRESCGIAGSARKFCATGATSNVPKSSSKKFRKPKQLKILPVAGELGFEPRQTESESVVLPLHHSPTAATAIPKRIQWLRVGAGLLLATDQQIASKWGPSTR